MASDMLPRFFSAGRTRKGLSSVMLHCMLPDLLFCYFVQYSVLLLNNEIIGKRKKY